MTNEPVRPKGFGSLVSSMFLVDLGFAMSLIALPLLLIKDYGLSFEVGLTLAIGVIPGFLLGPACGAMIENLDPRRLSMASALAAGCLTALLPFAGSLWQVQILAFALGVANMFEGPARMVLRSRVIEEGDELRGNGLIVASERVPTVLGPSIVAVLFTVIDLHLVFLAEAVLCLVAAVLILGVPDRPKPEEPRPWLGFRTELRTAYLDNTRDLIRTTAIDPFLRGLTLTAFTYIAAVNVGRFALIGFGDTRFHGTPGAYGYLAGAMGIGGVIGGLLATRLSRFSGGGLYVWCSLLEAAAWIAVATASNQAFVLLILCLAGVLESTATAVFFAQAQIRIPERFVGGYYAALIPICESFGFAGAALGAFLVARSPQWAAMSTAVLIAIPVLLTARWYFALDPLETEGYEDDVATT